MCKVRSEEGMRGLRAGQFGGGVGGTTVLLGLGAEECFLGGIFGDVSDELLEGLFLS